MEAAKSKSSNNFLTTLKKIFSDRILQITIVITIISLFFARPLSADMNWHTIESVTTMLVLIQVYSYLHVLDIIAYKLAAIADSTRKLILLFTLLSVFSGMFLGNDITCLGQHRGGLHPMGQPPQHLRGLQLPLSARYLL